MPKNGKGAIFVIFTLLLALASGVATALSWVGTYAVPLLVATALLTALMVALSGWIAYRLWRQEREVHQAIESGLRLPEPRRPWRWLSRRQWTMLTLGVTAIVTLTGAFAGVEVMNAQPVASHPTAGGDSPPQGTAVPAVPVTDSPTPAVMPSPPSPDASQSASTDPGAGGSGSSTDGPTDTGTPVPMPGVTGYLDTIGSVNGYYDHGPTTLSGARYPRSLTMECADATQNYIEWNVAGYRTFSSTLGVSDDASDAFGGVAEMIFYDQDGRQLEKPYELSVGHQQKVLIPLKGVVHLRVTCSARDVKTNRGRDFRGALGDAEVLG